FTILDNNSHLFNNITNSSKKGTSNSSNKDKSKRCRSENSNRMSKGSSSTNVDDRVTIEDDDFEDIERELEFFNDPNDAKTPPSPLSASESDGVEIVSPLEASIAKRRKLYRN
ncbi:hypothetical protein BCR42DRAFT_409208, partial [Absidia repens]